MSLHFSKLKKDEQDRKLSSLIRSGASLTIWKRGDKERFVLKLKDQESSALIVFPHKNNEIHFSDCMGHFSLSGLSFFFEANIEKSGEFYKVSNIHNFYKAERRTSFRLLTYPHKKVFLNFSIDEELLDSKESVVNIETGMSETGLFINFLDMIGDSKSERLDVKLRVQDLSVTGLCFEVGEVEKDYLSQYKEIRDVVLNFEDLEVEIPSVTIVYIKEHRNFLTNLKVYRVGVEFHELDEKVEQKIAQKINQYIHWLEEEFEEITK